MTKSLHDIVGNYAIHASSFFEPGSTDVLSGHNGPYGDPETPVRNTAHLLYMFSAVYRSTGEWKLKQAAERAISYLMSRRARPSGQTFHHRDADGKDRCNGLVGQAWCIESLVAAARVFGREDCYDLAEAVYRLHPFNDSVGLWQRRDIDGSLLSFDPTFNHQLWFAAAAALLDETPTARQSAAVFLTKVAAVVQTFPNGIIYHASPMGSLVNYGRLGAKALIGEARRRFRRRADSVRHRLYAKSIGYHAFNLYAFAMLKEALPGHPVWRTALIDRLMDACDSEEFEQQLRDSLFGYYYNVSGIELAYAYEVFRGDHAGARRWLQRQFDNTWANSQQPLGRDSTDAPTTNARVYAATRLRNDYRIEVVDD